MNTTNDHELLRSLGMALAPAPVEPGPEELAGLHRALAVWSGETVSTSSDRARTREGRWRANVLWMVTASRVRHSAAAVVAAVVLVTGGVAAAGVATNTLPGPTRAVAFDLGLPVSSPSLVAAQSEITTLQTALDSHDVSAVRSAAAVLRLTMMAMSTTDLDQIEPKASALLAEADTMVALGSTPDSAGRHSGSHGTGSDRPGADDRVAGRSDDGSGSGPSPGGSPGTSTPDQVQTGRDGANSGSGPGSSSGSGTGGPSGSGSSGSGSTSGGGGPSSGGGSGSSGGGASGSNSGSNGGSSHGGPGDSPSGGGTSGSGGTGGNGGP
jgi:hypothetical protein